MPASDLANALLAADRPERERLLRETPSSELEPALSELGHRRDQVAAEVLALADAVADDRGIRKAARRELHRLRSAGVALPEAPVATAQAPRATQPEVVLAEAWVSDFDPSGSRVMWLLGERRLGGVWFSALVLNDIHG